MVGPGQRRCEEGARRLWESWRRLRRLPRYPVSGNGVMDDRLQQYYERDPNVLFREVAGEQILVPVRKQAAEMAALYVLNETSAFVWNLLDGKHSLAEIRDRLVAEYEVTPETAESDLFELIERLKGLGVVRVVAHAM